MMQLTICSRRKVGDHYTFGGIVARQGKEENKNYEDSPRGTEGEKWVILFIYGVSKMFLGGLWEGQLIN